MKIGVTGYRGRLGNQLSKDCYILTCDITNEREVLRTIVDLRPDVVINCAAITDVDACEKDEDAAMEVNFYGVENVRKACDDVECRMIHISTDYVFNGKNGAYSETRKPLTVKNGEPVNSYGWSKLGGESIMIPDDNTIVVRTTGLYDHTDRHDFLKLVMDTVGQGKELMVTKQLIGNQTYVPHLAEGLLTLAEKPEIFKKRDILHIASKDRMSRYEFALIIAGMFGYDKELIIPVNNKDIPNWVAPRPTKGGLLTSQAVRDGIPIYTIMEGLQECKNQIFQS